MASERSESPSVLQHRSRDLQSRAWAVTAISGILVSGLLAVLGLAVADGRADVAMARSAVDASIIGDEALATLLALNAERASGLRAGFTRHADDIREFRELWDATDRKLMDFQFVLAARTSSIAAEAAVEFGDFFQAASALDDVRRATIGETAEGQFATYVSVIEPLVGGIQQVLSAEASPQSIPERRAVSALVGSLDSLEQREAVVAGELASESEITEDDRIRIEILSQGARSGMAVAAALVSNDLVARARSGSEAEQVNMAIGAIAEGDSDPYSVAAWYEISGAQKALLEQAIVDLSGAVRNRALEIEDRAGSELVIRWMVFALLAVGGILVAAIAIKSNRARLRALAEYGEIATGLTRWFQPDQLPEVEGVDMVVRYRPSSEMTSAGGDWYDSFLLDERRLALVIGDVAGHGPKATSNMAELRHVLRGQATARPLTPAQQLRLLDETTSDDDIYATLIYGVLDFDSGRLEFSRAGHVPLCVVGSDGLLRVVEDGAGPPIGVDRESPRTNGVVQLSAGDVIAMMTDGVVERRHKDIDKGLALVGMAIDQPLSGLDELADVLMPTQSDEVGDDMAVLLARWSPEQGRSRSQLGGARPRTG
ncbi:MAG: PP2C family protein-serine/threonine phosphatase [Acidimicrobiia bacterium]|nr:PP2C family protein-serine/threonine phosphatase [Acidimicrobiia bacterium]